MVWCAQNQQADPWNNPTQQDEDWFEERHADAMDERDQLALREGGGLSETIDLLMPENEQDIVTETVEYTPWVEGFLAYPQDKADAPWVVVIHERWWLNEHIEDMARILAMNGYRALAVDLYGGVVAEDSDQARELSSSLDNQEAERNLLDAEEFLRDGSSQVASLWWCMGWAQSLNLSIASESLDATVIYYGRLSDDQDRLRSINTPLLWIFAEEDNGIPPEAVSSFTGTLNNLWIDNIDVTVYPWVWHAFANPTGWNFEQEATLDARSNTLEFLRETLQ